MLFPAPTERLVEGYLVGEFCLADTDQSLLRGVQRALGVERREVAVDAGAPRLGVT